MRLKKNNNIIKIIALGLSFSLLWNGVMWADPNVFEKETLQPLTRFTDFTTNEFISGIVGKYLKIYFRGIENDFRNLNVQHLQRLINERLKQIKALKNVPPEVNNKIPDKVRTDKKNACIVDLGSVKIRYYNHQIPGAEVPDRDPDNRFYKAYPVFRGDYLSKQFLVEEQNFAASNKFHPNSPGPALFFDFKTDTWRALKDVPEASRKMSEHDVMNIACKELVFDRNKTSLSAGNPVYDYVSKDSGFEEIKLYILNDDEFKQNLTDKKSQCLAKGLITHAGTYTDPATGLSRALNLFMPESVYNYFTELLEKMSSMKYAGELLAFWKTHELRHLKDRKADIDGKFTESEKDAAEIILWMSKTLWALKKNNLHDAFEYVNKIETIESHVLCLCEMRGRLHEASGNLQEACDNYFTALAIMNSDNAKVLIGHTLETKTIEMIESLQQIVDRNVNKFPINKKKAANAIVNPKISHNLFVARMEAVSTSPLFSFDEDMKHNNLCIIYFACVPIMCSYIENILREKNKITSFAKEIVRELLKLIEKGKLVNPILNETENDYLGRVYYIAGEVFAGLGSTNKAFECFEQALDYDDTVPVYYARKAEFLVVTKKTMESLAEARELLSQAEQKFGSLEVFSSAWVFISEKEVSIKNAFEEEQEMHMFYEEMLELYKNGRYKTCQERIVEYENGKNGSPKKKISAELMRLKRDAHSALKSSLNAQKWIKMGDMSQAEWHFRRVLLKNPNDSNACKIVNIFERETEMQKQQVITEHLLQQKLSEAKKYVSSAKDREERGLIAKARKSYQSALAELAQISYKNEEAALLKTELEKELKEIENLPDRIEKVHGNNHDEEPKKRQKIVTKKNEEAPKNKEENDEDYGKPKINRKIRLSEKAARLLGKKNDIDREKILNMIKNVAAGRRDNVKKIEPRKNLFRIRGDEKDVESRVVFTFCDDSSMLVLLIKKKSQIKYPNILKHFTEGFDYGPIMASSEEMEDFEKRIKASKNENVLMAIEFLTGGVLILFVCEIFRQIWHGKVCKKLIGRHSKLAAAGNFIFREKSYFPSNIEKIIHGLIVFGSKGVAKVSEFFKIVIELSKIAIQKKKYFGIFQKPVQLWYDRSVTAQIPKEKIMKNLELIVANAENLEEETKQFGFGRQLKTIDIGSYVKSLSILQNMLNNTNISTYRLKNYIREAVTEIFCKQVNFYREEPLKEDVELLTETFDYILSEESRHLVKEDALKFAVGIFIDMLKSKKMLMNGNHRIISMIMNFILLKNGFPCFVLTLDNVVKYYAISKSIQRGDRNYSDDEITEFFRKEIEKNREKFNWFNWIKKCLKMPGLKNPVFLKENKGSFVVTPNENKDSDLSVPLKEIKTPADIVTMKAPAASPIELDARVDLKYITGLISQARERTDEANISEAVGYINVHAPPFNGSRINPANIKLFSIDLGKKLGIPRFKMAESAQDLIYVFPIYDSEKNILKLYATKQYFESQLKNNALALAEAIDHEYTEKVLGYSHRVACSRSYFFATEKNQLTPFHNFYINQIISEGNFSLAKFIVPERHASKDVIEAFENNKTLIGKIENYDKRFFDYLCAVVRLRDFSKFLIRQIDKNIAKQNYAAFKDSDTILLDGVESGMSPLTMPDETELREKLFDVISKESTGQGKILSLGIGRGLFEAPFVGAGYDMTGMDFCPEVLSCAKKRGIKTIEADVDDQTVWENLHKNHAKFDTVIIPESIGYYDEDKLFENIKTILKPGGDLYILVSAELAGLSFGYKGFNYNQIKEKLKRSGFLFNKKTQCRHYNGKKTTICLVKASLPVENKNTAVEAIKKQYSVFDGSESLFGGISGHISTVASPEASELRKKLSQVILKQTGPSSKILSLAVGNGIFEENFVRAGCTVTGVDCTPEVLELAKQRGINTIEADVNNSNLWQELEKKEKFDAVIISETIGYFNEDVLFERIKKVLNPGGRIYILTTRNSEERMPDYKRFNSRRIRAKLRKSGFICSEYFEGKYYRDNFLKVRLMTTRLPIQRKRTENQRNQTKTKNMKTPKILWDGERIIRNVEEIVPRLVQGMIDTAEEAFQKKEKVILYLDEAFSQNNEEEVSGAIEDVINLLTNIKNNNKSLFEFLNGKLEVRCGTKEEFKSKKGKVKSENIIVVTTKANYEAGYFSTIDGNGIIAAIDDKDLPQKAYCPLVETVFFAIGKYLIGKDLNWNEEKLCEWYEKIPNVTLIKDLSKAEYADLFNGNAKSIIVRLIPNAVEFKTDDKHAEIIRHVRDVLSKA
ncbi:MAG: class I SAM-dependent methyltransferase [Candidatus Omnitrophota bacterium]